MFDSVRVFYGDEDARLIVEEIRSSMTHPPMYEPLAHETRCFVLDDDQWHIYKKSLAKIAKERKTKTPINTAKRRKVREFRDMDIPAIEISNGSIVCICDTTFGITKFKNMDEVSADKVYCSHVRQALRGDIDRFDHYFWVINPS
jgi:hypothetical protein